MTTSAPIDQAEDDFSDIPETPEAARCREAWIAACRPAPPTNPDRRIVVHDHAHAIEAQFLDSPTLAPPTLLGTDPLILEELRAIRQSLAILASRPLPGRPRSKKAADLPLLADSTEADLLRRIVDTRIMCGGQMRSVRELVAKFDTFDVAASLLEHSGVTLTFDTPGPRSPNHWDKRALFIHPGRVSKLLGGDQPAPPAKKTAKVLAKILLRIPGAYREQRTLNGKRHWGVELPIKCI